LASGARVFALAMIRAEAELSDRPFSYASESGTGAAHILASPPALR
jgi:hypothetical protein